MPLARSLRSFGAFCGALLLAVSGASQTAPTPAEPPREVRNLERSTVDRVESDGTLTRRERFRVQILSPGGLAQYSQVGVAFSETSEQAKLELLRVHKPDGRILDLLSTAPTDIAPVFPTELPIYSDLRMLRAAVPSLGLGDQLEFESSVLSRPIAPGHVWLEMKFAKAGEVDEQVYVLDTPSDSRLRVSLREGLQAQFDEEHRDGRWIRRWRLAASPDPASTPATSPLTNEAPDIQITTFRTWNEFGLWWASLAPPLVDDKVRAKALELTTGLSEPTARLRALHRYVAQEIRYLALPLGIGRYRAREPGEILSSELGDCKDKFRLLASLAESVGLAVEPVLIYASAKRTFVEEAPSPLQFDHVIARARLGSDEIWMDPTAELVPMGSLPRSSRGRPGVALSQTQKSLPRAAPGEIVAALLTTPAELPAPSSVSVDVAGSLAADGVLRARVRWTFSGDDEVARAVYKYGDEKLRRTAFEGLRREWAGEARIGAVTNGDPSALDQPFWIEYPVELPMTASVWRKAWDFWLPTPFTAVATPPSAEDDTAQGQPLERLELEGTVRQRVSARIELPEGVRVSAPVAMSSRREFAEFRSDYRLEGRTLFLERELTYLTTAIPRSRFEELRDLRKLVVSDYAQEFTIAAAPALAPADRTAAELRAECWDALESRLEKEAEHLCRQAITLDPMESDAWNNLGLALERQNRPGEARAAYEKQLEVAPRHAYAYANLGLLAWADDDLAKAEKLLRQQVEIAPLTAFGYAKLGRLLAGTNRLDEAESLLRRATKLDPEDLDGLGELLMLEARRGRFDAVAEMVAETPALGSDLEHVAPVIALLTLQEPGRWHALRAWLERIAAESQRALAGEGTLPPTRDEIAAAANLAAAWEGLARATLEEGRQEEAWSLANAAVELGHSPTAFEGRSAVLRARGETGRADRDLAIAAELARPHAQELERRLATFVPSSAAREALTRQAQVEAWKARSIGRRSPDSAGSQGEIWLLFRADGQLRRASPVGGSPTGALARALEKEPVSMALPSSNRAHIPAKALAYCGQDGECSLTVEPPGQTWMSMKDKN